MPTNTKDNTIQGFCEKILAQAWKDGLAVGNPVSYTMLSNNWGDFVEVVSVSRKVIVSYETPACPQTAELPVLIWVDPSSMKVYKSSNWRDTQPIWEGQSSYANVFNGKP